MPLSDPLRRPVRPGRARPARRIALIAALGTLAVATAGCGLTAVTGPRTWAMGSTTSTGQEHTITVTDTSGRVTDVEEPPDAGFPAAPVVVPAGLPDRLDVSWTGGDCDKTTDVAIAPRGNGLAIRVTITPNGQVCDAMGVTRVIRLTMAQPIPPAAVTVTQ
jgi:hypothetical protein